MIKYIIITGKAPIFYYISLTFLYIQQTFTCNHLNAMILSIKLIAEPKLPRATV